MTRRLWVYHGGKLKTSTVSEAVKLKKEEFQVMFTGGTSDSIKRYRRARRAAEISVAVIGKSYSSLHMFWAFGEGLALCASLFVVESTTGVRGIRVATSCNPISVYVYSWCQVII